MSNFLREMANLENMKHTFKVPNFLEDFSFATAEP